MIVLPATDWAYAVRSLVVIAALMLAGIAGVFRERIDFQQLVWGLLIGVVALFIWVFPENFDWYRVCCIAGHPQSVARDVGSPLTWIRLFGSAFVVSVAEELFFRKWLIRFAGFWWMVALFAVEHNRFLVGAIVGVLYGWLYLRKGLFSAIIAHATTNLLLGLYVIQSGRWEFW